VAAFQGRNRQRNDEERDEAASCPPSVLRLSSALSLKSAVVLAILVTGLLGTLIQLCLSTRGAQAGLAVAAGFAVLACQLLFRRASLRSALLRSLPWMLLVSLIVSLTTTTTAAGDPAAGIGISLCWSLLSAAAVFGAASCLPDAAEPTGLKELAATVDQSQSSEMRAIEAVEERFESERHPGFLQPPARAVTLGLFNDRDGVENEDFLEEDFEEEEFKEGWNAENQPVQHWSRFLTDTDERLQGSLRTLFPAGQKQCYVHVPFLPFFRLHPSGYCECESEADVVAELDSLHAYGARVLLRRRGELSDPVDVRISLVVTAPLVLARSA